MTDKWTSSCRSHHVSCPKDPTFLPTRLVQLHPNGIRLVETPTGKKGIYTALSHCWGSAQTSKTTASTLKSFSQNIDVLHLPKSFQDAILITRKLGIAYIWIDSLCIIQDSAGDWHREASRMENYYSNCFLNISALSARDSNVGFLNRRKLAPDVQLQDDLRLRHASRPWGTVFYNSPLSQRAWVLQERLLSNRVLHFGDEELFWECSTLSARESSSESFTLQAQSTAWEDANFKRSLNFGPSNTIFLEEEIHTR